MSPDARISPAPSSGLTPRIRLCLSLLMVGLVLSGVAESLLVHETAWLEEMARSLHLRAAVVAWLARVAAEVAATGATRWVTYGADWLLFGHVVAALVFVGPFREPIRNRWVVDFGLLACAGVLPLVLIAGPLRGIPVLWRLLDCSFAVAGGVLLLLCRHYIALLERAQVADREQRRARRRRMQGRRGRRLVGLSSQD